MKKTLFTICALMFTLGMSAQKDQSQWENGLPKAGDMAIGVNFNPVATGKSVRDFSETGNFVGNTILDLNDRQSYPNQMFFLAQDPMVSFQFKYMLTNHSAIKARIGFSGAVLNYREYVQDDAAAAIDEFSPKQVSDRIRCQYSGGGVTLGMEFSKGNRLRFVGGFGLVYAFGGGRMDFSYGNAMNAYNQQPSTMDKINNDLSQFEPNEAMEYARPTKQYNVGLCHAFGVSGTMGVEWFFIPKVSVGAEVSIIPVMVAFQPQTYIKYEGVNRYTQEVQEYTDFISKGSSYLLYGTENISLNLSLHYYF